MDNRRKFASVSAFELAAAAAALVLLIASAEALGQTPNPATPAAAPPSSAVPSAPPTKAASTTAPPPVAADGRPIVAGAQARVLADPDTRIYSRCKSEDEDVAPGGDSDSDFKPNPKSQVMSEEAAKAKGFRAGAHKVACK